MTLTRQCGILLHPTSLPGQYGIGDLGDGAYQFIDFLSAANQKLWQVLPLNPVGYGESPYQALSAFAGNPLLISLEGLISSELLSQNDVHYGPTFSADRVDFELVKEFKYSLFKKAYLNFKQRAVAESYLEFINECAYWLEDFALFMALKEHFNQLPWNQWEESIAKRDSSSLEYYKRALANSIEFQYFLQYIFYMQWLELKQYANDCGIKIIGDLPIYVAYDSADTWSKPNLFQLDNTGTPIVVSGVPPDYFSETGQLWGNPIYNWTVAEQSDFKWWKQRFEAIFKVVDIVRIDHFRGFEAYWEVPYGEETAINGKWVKAPGIKFFSEIKKHFPNLPIIAEDLGVITPEVNELKNMFNLPGMKILQFTLESDDLEYFSPYYFDINSVVYTGTHDNDTTIGWLKNKRVTRSGATLNRLEKNFSITSDISVQEANWRMIEIAYQSPADTCIIPMQDILCLDSDARMNYPGTIGGNWTWRFKTTDIEGHIIKKLKDLTLFYNR